MIGKEGGGQREEQSNDQTMSERDREREMPGRCGQEDRKEATRGRRGGREQDANSAEKGQWGLGGKLVQGDEARPVRKEGSRASVQGK